MLMNVEKNVKRIWKFLMKNKWTAIVSVIVLLVRIKNSVAPYPQVFAQIDIISMLLERPVEGSTCAEVLNFLDTLGMSFLASLVFLFTSITLPNIKKNRIVRDRIEECVNMILEKTENIITGCLGIYMNNPEAPRRPFSEYKDEDIAWIVNNVQFQIKICLEGTKYITGYHFMYETSLEVIKMVKHLQSNYREYLNADEVAVLEELKKSCYIQKCLKRRIDCMQSGRIDIPKETVDEIRKNMPQVKATGGIKIAEGLVEESEIKNGVELYNKIKKTFII